MLDPLNPASSVQFRCKNPRLRFTDLALRSLPYSHTHAYVWDTAFPTLGMRIGKRTKTFIVIKPGGKRITLGKYPFMTLSDARQRAAKLYGHATIALSNAPTALQAVSTFFDTHVAKNRPKTQKDTIRLINKHFIPPLGSTAIDRITTQDITAITDAMRRTPAEAIKAHAAMSVLFRWAVRRQMIPKNPMQGLPLPARPAQRDRVLTDAELTAVLRAALKIINTPFGAMLMIAIYTGMRRGEVEKLKWSYITRDKITLPKEIVKNNTEHVLPNTINGYLTAIPRTNDDLFPRIDSNSAKKKFDALCGVNGWVVHDLRRTFSTKMAEWEIAPPDIVEAILNHKAGSRNKIQRIYDRHNRFPQMHRALSAYADRLHALMKAQ